MFMCMQQSGRKQHHKVAGSLETQHEKKQEISVNMIHLPDTELSSSESLFALLLALALFKFY